MRRVAESARLEDHEPFVAFVNRCQALIGRLCLGELQAGASELEQTLTCPPSLPRHLERLVLRGLVFRLSDEIRTHSEPLVIGQSRELMVSGAKAQSLRASSLRPILELMLNHDLDPSVFISSCRVLSELLRPHGTEQQGRTLASFIRPCRLPTIVRLATIEDELVGRVTSAIRQAVRQRKLPYSEEHAATEIGVSRSTLCHQFKNRTGHRFSTWRTAIILHAAFPRIILSDDQIAQIAYGLGFSHAAQLNHGFCSLGLDVSPTALRMMCSEHQESSAKRQAPALESHLIHD